MENNEIMELGDILIYQTEKGDTSIVGVVPVEAIWMSPAASA